ncbi:hypothetical protein MP228_004458 [Amoeboaphelidium protococcarum]|nr:hypothetical protein MP228_004458 [Amoeboaphelidium protococcarum]
MDHLDALRYRFDALEQHLIDDDLNNYSGTSNSLMQLRSIVNAWKEVQEKVRPLQQLISKLWQLDTVLNVVDVSEEGDQIASSQQDDQELIELQRQDIVANRENLIEFSQLLKKICQPDLVESIDRLCQIDNDYVQVNKVIEMFNTQRHQIQEVMLIQKRVENLLIGYERYAYLLRQLNTE